MRTKTRCTPKRQSGHAVLEVALLAPWIFFLFVGALDVGFYAHALVATQNAARTAAEYTSKGTNTASAADVACSYALYELKAMSNVRSLSNCNSAPLIVTATAVTGVDGAPASSVSVTYQSNLMIPIPGLMRQLAVTRTVQMRVRNL
jgi:Flp pilus assembly protein TadG